jgi:regulator of protease activity HflC (stomatin/prohibitin superfamily)
MTTDIRTVRKGLGGIALLAMLLIGSCATIGVVESVDAGEIMVIQDAMDGELHFYTSPGIKPQWWGRVTNYQKRATYEFKAPVTFNDGGKGEIHGSVQYELPLDAKNLTELHTKYGSDEAIQKLMETVTNKVVYMTGPTMSSRESYAEKKNYLINYAQDQIDHGVYRTRQAAQEQVDQFSGNKRILMVSEIVMDGGKPVRQEQSVVGEFGIRAFNFSIQQIDYDDTVEAQIKKQQEIQSDVQTAIADAVKAQQRAITLEQQGRADAAKAKWDQEVLKAKAVTAAEQALEVQKLSVQTAEAYKQEQLLRSDADATAKRRAIEADGALASKLATYERVNQMWAEAFKNYPGQLVPSVIMGSGSGGGNGAASMQQFMELLGAKAALDLGVSTRPSGGGRGGGNP